jgi:hypothetical protein
MSPAHALPDPPPKGFSLRNARHALHLIERVYDLYQQWSDAGKPPPDRMEFRPVVCGRIVFADPFWRTLAYRRAIGGGTKGRRRIPVVEHTPAGVCARRGRQLFVVFRGTLSPGEKISNWMAGRMDAVFDDLPGGGVHRGFHRCYASVRGAIHRYLAAQASPLRSIRVAGHSLGGALATLAAMDIATCGLPFRRLEVFSFASPRVGSARWARHFDRQPIAAWRIANRRDLVARMPPTFLGYRHAGTPLLFTSPPGIPPHSLHAAYLPGLAQLSRPHAAGAPE